MLDFYNIILKIITNQKDRRFCINYISKEKNEIKFTRI